MLSSQLGRVILSGSAASADEMSVAPDPNGKYGPMDGFLEEVAFRVEDVPRRRGGRRPENVSSSD